jgi:hypothetical protein
VLISDVREVVNIVNVAPVERTGKLVGKVFKGLSDIKHNISWGFVARGVVGDTSRVGSGDQHDSDGFHKLVFNKNLWSNTA